MNMMIAAREDDIRALAHKFWEEEGRPVGRHEIHWQRALAAAVVPDLKPAKATRAKANPVKIDQAKTAPKKK